MVVFFTQSYTHVKHREGHEWGLGLRCGLKTLINTPGAPVAQLDRVLPSEVKY